MGTATEPELRWRRAGFASVSAAMRANRAEAVFSNSLPSAAGAACYAVCVVYQVTVLGSWRASFPMKPSRHSRKLGENREVLQRPSEPRADLPDEDSIGLLVCAPGSNHVLKPWLCHSQDTRTCGVVDWLFNLHKLRQPYQLRAIIYAVAWSICQLNHLKAEHRFNSQHCRQC